ncbi:MarR family transcriptional regulator [Planococcus sp. N028]|uniref:MarR family transcriptional regulator n=1 Tax=Planococcus shixiaomingii TaxID=3058393 RepID=A0ABT8N6D1_9BACL|nr:MULTISPECIES: MarR family transcriptional regulator [unclassified Planococcus (in: firmicutes)]MDN7243217.1 MarR family transcriptional regulator [Planococcus sp. N028]WKA55160.1 MarR family transcriptional regulator [Planococcus sp. N022]
MRNLLFHEIHQKSRLSVKEVNEVLKEFDLYSSQWSILFCLKQLGAMTQKEIWQYLHVEAPTVTRTLVRLEQSGWIVRREGKDKRERIVDLSDQAEQLMPKIEQRVIELEEKLLSGLTDEEQQQLVALIKKIGAQPSEKDV